jgi:hypothetical protein
VSAGLQYLTMSYNRPKQAPAGYVAGLGRGAAGFVTASDVSAPLLPCVYDSTTSCAQMKIVDSIFCKLARPAPISADWTGCSPSCHRHRRLNPRRFSIGRTPCRQTSRPKAAEASTTLRPGSRRLCRGSRTRCLHLWKRRPRWSLGRRG